ncbi:Putative Cell division control protein [Penicillium brasilianum]|uniref:Probable E3 ubiquitin ligase complex SCF subunit sconB n=1 Tax=Penicillium brasilianum TaxID=104259 RepID=A0A0F7VCZ3_PENBI|nr:Putative Cell division control protein [Penicillium brasilianum]
MDEHDQDDGGQGPSSNDSFAQFSFAPATRTTVVTTTTTTTTSFPPLLIKPPRATKDLDTRLYPLASTPTPANLRNLRFRLGDQSIVFNEPNDTTAAFTELNEKNDALKSSNGLIRSVNSFSTEDDSATRRLTAPRTVDRTNNPNPPHRPVSPVSISDPRPAILPRTRAYRVPSEPVARRTRHYASTSTHLSPAGLATPETEHNIGSLGDGLAPKQRVQSANFPRRETLLRSPLSAEVGSSDAGAQKLLENLAQNRELQPTKPDATAAVTSDPSSFTQTVSFASTESSSQRMPDLTAQLSAIDNAMAQDMCLPSPSLSPVAAMNALHGESSFDFEGPDIDTDSSLDHNVPRYSKTVRLLDTDVSRPKSLATTYTSRSPPSLMDMPKVLEFFDSVPDELKSYLMYQFLRRCPKPTLHFVADVVNPTLKCDFLTMLPLELSLNIVKYFDVQTMCRASQVSKKWRHIVSSDEKTWKDLLDRDGYALSEGELERAIREGWGWQCSTTDDFERDLSKQFSSRADGESSPIASSSHAHERAPLTSLTPNRRPKRKANTRASSRKLAKRKISSSGTDYSEPDWKRDIAASEAPYAAANAAAAAVPYPNVGMPTLRGLYLYKALYRRHHAIRRGWMKPEVKPQHLAFRAHDRHVVTCLQFDTDKILTGSDDTNINVYDTKTGALKATLEGHEGGVWALEYYGNTLVSGSTDRSVRVWDIERARCTQVFNGHTSTVRCLQIVLPTEVGKDANGRPEIMPKVPLIITGSRDSNLRVWKLPKPGDPSYYPNGPLADDTDCPYFVRVLSGHSHSVRAIAAHGDTLVSGSYDCTVRVWKISTGQVLHTLQGHSLKVYSVVLDHKRNRCISGAMDHMVKVWSLEDGSLLHNLEGHTSLVGLLSLQSDYLVSAAADSTLRIWDPEHGHCKNMLSAHTGAITCFQHDGQKVISGSDRTLKMWDVSTGACVRDLLTDLSGVWQVKFNDRRCVAAVQRDSLTYIEVLDFGAARDGVPENKLGKRIVVNRRGREIATSNVDSDSDSD